MLSIFDQGALPPCPDDFNLSQYVLRHAKDTPDKTALEVLGAGGSDRWTYAELETAVLGTGAGLLSLGYSPGQRVLMRLGNTVDFPIAYLGAIAVGLVPIPTSSQLTEAEVVTLAAQVAPDVVVQDPTVACPEVGCRVISTSQLRQFWHLPPADYDLGDPNRLAYILFTSGTSGQQRPVTHAHRAIWARQMMWRDWYGISSQDRLLHAGAFNWSFTLGTGLLDPWSVGATSLILQNGTDASSLPALLGHYRATIFAAAPGVFRQMLSHTPMLDLPDLRHGLCAGEKLSENIRANWIAATGLGLHEAFGMSECSTFISASPSSPMTNRLGRPQTGRRVAIVGEDGPVPLGVIGQIAVSRRDPGLMLGYLNALDETSARFQGEWFLTGDLGEMHDDFSISYHARADDMMNAGGFRVSPLEVEGVLHDHPLINDIAVRDIEVKTDTKVIAAFYTSDTEIADADLHSFVANKLARYKQPRIYSRVDRLPRGANNKLQRKKLELDKTHYET